MSFIVDGCRLPTASKVNGILASLTLLCVWEQGTAVAASVSWKCWVLVEKAVRQQAAAVQRRDSRGRLEKSLKRTLTTVSVTIPN